MTPRQLLVIAALLVGLTGVAVVARKTETSGERLYRPRYRLSSLR
jgi:hypothetical protein